MSSGNRCGHDPKNLRHGRRFVRHGKGGMPQVLGVISARIKKAVYTKSMLTSWHAMCRRQRRSEIREAMESVLQYLVGEWFQLDSRACGKLKGDTMKVPDAEFIALEISRGESWKGRPPMSVWRVRAIIKQFEACGYFKLTKQRKFQHETGEWESGPKLITFTKKFFMELGGEALWKQVHKASLERVTALMTQFKDQGFTNIRRALARAFRPLYIRTPRQIKSGPPPLSAAYA